MSPLESLAASLERYRHGDLRTHAFTALWRQEAAALESLPPAFGEVLEGLLMRLESSSQFAEESCSFSRGELLAHLELWLDKARARGSLRPAQ